MTEIRPTVKSPAPTMPCKVPKAPMSKVMKGGKMSHPAKGPGRCAESK